MKLNLINQKEITDLEAELNIELVVSERPKSYKLPIYHVSFENCETMEGGCLVGSFGNGNTIDEAILDYCKEIETKKVAFRAFTNGRFEYNMPKLIHTKLLNR